MKKVKVIFDREGCIGAAACVAVAPQFWRLLEDGKAELIGSKFNTQTRKYELEIEVDDEIYELLKDSAEACPVIVIEFYEKDEKGNWVKIYPSE